MEGIKTREETRRMTFWLPVPVIEKIKKRWLPEKKRTASAILRELLGKYLKNK